MQFSIDQKYAFERYIQGQNLFVTGPGGSGKSVLVKNIYQNALKRGQNIHVCAMTGCAAVLLQCKAKTLHSWAGIGRANKSIEQYVRSISKNAFQKAIWKTTDILIVDEVSMMSKKIFDILNAIGKSVRRNSKPFGGIQVIFCGDFYQLPPVGDKDEIETTQFCFESEEWNNAFSMETHICLKTIFRQNDSNYKNILNQVREGRIRRSSIDMLHKQVGKTIEATVIIKPTKLFPTRMQVDNINTKEMIMLEGENKEFKMKTVLDLEMTPKERIIRSSFTKEQIMLELNYLKSNLRCDDEIFLKIGSQVMCTINMELTNGDMICNGSQGIVIGFSESRNDLPVIRFHNGYEMTMNYHVWPSENIPGVGISQLPLILAWALTIHKSQGATLDYAEIDVGHSIFECGQTYVALSRVKSLEGLYLTSFDPSKIRINRKVQEFYEHINHFQKQKSVLEQEATKDIQETMVEEDKTIKSIKISV
jgi:ATP-dependent DNA helicase PIF1